MSNRATPSPAPSGSSRDELMFLGKTCHHQDCNLNDFLPFHCPACKQTFCQPHFLPSKHACTAPLPPSMIDRIAPSCPLCNEVVPYPPGGRLDPNEAVERHLLAGTCVGLPGGEERKKAEQRRKKEEGKICYRRGCSKVLIVPMVCEGCGHKFCAPHRHAKEHSCGSISGSGSGSSTPAPKQTPAAGTRPGAKTAMSRLLAPSSSKTPSSSNAGPSKPNPVRPVQAAQSAAASLAASASATADQFDARANAAAAAMKRAGQDAKVPFVKTKTEKRANDELQSTIKSLKARHDKGLLSKAEELKYAQLVGEQEGLRRKGLGKKDGDCIIA